MTVYRMKKSDFVDLMQKMKHLNEGKEPVESYFPVRKDIVRMGHNIETYFTYLLFIFANNREPKTLLEAQSMNEIRNLIKLSINFEDGKIPECLEETFIAPSWEGSVSREDFDAALDEAYESAAEGERERIADKLVQETDLPDDLIAKLTSVDEAKVFGFRIVADAKAGESI